jgi:hypothetical protein
MRDVISFVISLEPLTTILCVDDNKLSLVDVTFALNVVVAVKLNDVVKLTPSQNLDRNQAVVTVERDSFCPREVVVTLWFVAFVWLE